MRYNGSLFFAAILGLLFLLGISFAQIEDSLIVPLNPGISSETDEISYKNINLHWAASYTPHTIFFTPGVDKLDKRYQELLKQISSRLIQNPDLYCEIRGYYSPEIDDIDSPSVGEELALSRAKVVRNYIMLEEPQLSLKVKATSEGYEITEKYANDSDRFDSRVEICFYIPDWNRKVVVSTTQKPYWRRGFRIIAEKQSVFLERVLNRNPDLLLLFSSGDLDLPAKEAYERIAVVVDKFKKEIDIEDENRFVGFYGGKSKPGEMIIDLVGCFCGSEINNRNQLLIEPADYKFPKLEFNLAKDSLAEPKYYRLNFNSFGCNFPLRWGQGDPPQKAIIDFNESDFLPIPGDGEFSLQMWRANGESEMSEWIDIPFTYDSTYYEMAIIPEIHFYKNTIEPIDCWEISLTSTVDRFLWFIDEDFTTIDMKIIGYSLDSEQSPDSLALARAEFLWERLSNMLLYRLNEKSMEAMGEFFKDNNISIEIRSEITSPDSPSPIPWASGTMMTLPLEHLSAWAPFAAIIWEVRLEDE